MLVRSVVDSSRIVVVVLVDVLVDYENFHRHRWIVVERRP